jgi:hypothetical protein
MRQIFRYLFLKNFFLALIFRRLALKYFIGAMPIAPIFNAKNRSLLQNILVRWQKMCIFVETFWRDFRCT